MALLLPLYCIFFFNDTATTEIYTLSLHDALPILGAGMRIPALLLQPYCNPRGLAHGTVASAASIADRKSTRLNSSHANISYAVFCLKKKKIAAYAGRASTHRIHC